MKSTTNYNLSLYEANDTPNLLDGYNNSMGKIDSALKVTNDTLSATLNEFEAQSPKLDTLTKQMAATADSGLRKLINTDVDAIHQVDADQDTLISNNATNIENLKGQHIVIIGDSFTATNVRAYSWPTKLKTKKTIHNYAVAGAGFTVSNNLFSTQLTTAINDSAFKNTEVSHVFVYGILNDFLNVTQTASSNTADAIKAVYNTALNNFTNAKIHMVLFNSSGMWRSSMEKWLNYINNITQYLIASNPIPFISASHWLYGFGKTTVYNTDEVHPNERGASIIAHYMNMLLNGDYLTKFNHRAVELNTGSGDSASTLYLITNNFDSNTVFKGRLHCENLVSGQNTISFTPDDHLKTGDLTVFVPSWACANDSVKSVYASYNTGQLYIRTSEAISEVNIYF